MARMMLVDDEPNILRSLRRAINTMPAERFGGKLTIETFEQPKLALERARLCAFEIVISDFRMPEMDGVAFLSELIEIQPNIARLMLSGYADLQSVVAAINRVQIFRFIAKPWDDYELETGIAQALQTRNLLLENQRLADLVRVQEGKLTRHELEMQKLEQQYPGLTKVKRGADGSIDLDLELDDES